MSNVRLQSNEVSSNKTTTNSEGETLGTSDRVEESIVRASNEGGEAVSSNHIFTQPTSALDTESPIRVPGTHPPEWLPDHETDSCMSCDSLFTLIRRRHHCRSCGKIFCGDCCRQKAKLLYLDNKEARVCNQCHDLIEYTLLNTDRNVRSTFVPVIPSSAVQRSTTSVKVHGVLKTVNQSRSDTTECNNPSSLDPPVNKQVMFADGIRPGTDLSETTINSVPASSCERPSTSYSLLTRQRRVENQSLTKRRGAGLDSQNITVCDEQGYLPPIVLSKDSLVTKNGETNASTASSLANIIMSQFKLSGGKKDTQATVESRSGPLDGVVKFEEISDLVGDDGVVSFLLLRDLVLRVKLTTKHCCIDKERQKANLASVSQQSDTKLEEQVYWCSSSEGLSRLGQNEVVLVIDKDKDDPCVPRDVFKIFLTLHELALRRQSLENLGNLLFQDGLFDNRDTAGLLFVRPLKEHCLNGLILPASPYLFAILLQRWEVPWSKVFPIRLLLRLGHKYDSYPYPIVSFRSREPVYYEVGHTIISILGDFRNFRYSITHVDGLEVTVNRASRKVLVKVQQSSYQQFNKVLDSSNNEHVLAWSSSPISEADGHLVSVQNEDGQYETVEFYKKSLNQAVSFENLESSRTLGASFIIFSGALKANQTGQSAKIGIVEDGLLIQIQSCTMSALRNAIHFMHHFDIDCENNLDPLNRVEIVWQREEN
mgnify:CR=1 FL=1